MKSNCWERVFFFSFFGLDEKSIAEPSALCKNKLLGLFEGVKTRNPGVETHVGGVEEVRQDMMRPILAVVP